MPEAMREGSVHSSVRKAQATGITKEEMEQVVAIAASTPGMPSVVAVYTWVQDEIVKTARRSPYCKSQTPLK